MKAMEDFSLRILIADDHPAILAGLESVLKDSQGISLVGCASNSTEIMGFLEANPCDVLVTDYSMPGGAYGDGLIMLNLIKEKYPSLKIVVLTMIESMGVIKSLTSQGIHRIVHKSDSLGSLLPAIYAAYTGGHYISPGARKIIEESCNPDAVVSMPKLSRREKEVLMLFVSGMTVSEISKKLFRSIKTISTHKVSVMQKLGIEKDVDLIRYGIEMGWVDVRK